jgi:hypothetical protein
MLKPILVFSYIIEGVQYFCKSDKVRLLQKVPAKIDFAGKSNLAVCCNIISSARLLQKPRTGL